ncbi:MAG TPA: helix-turn-helix domain-containing protein [Longimicrobium sp.]|nr:helix-turn-helix domain-containing protein [Longimicrobium sp.]
MSARHALLPERTLIVTETPALQRLRELPAEYRVRPVETWAELGAAMDQAPPSATVLADPYLGRRPADGPAPDLRRLIARRPSIPVIATLPLRSDAAGDVATLLGWEVSDILNLYVQRSADAVRECVRGVRARPLKRKVEPLLTPYASENARNVVRAACEVAVEGGAAPELAAIFQVDPRTVTAWCRREGLPPPRRLLAWTRVLLAAMMLGEHGRSIMNVARSAGYATDHALRRAMRDLFGDDPSTAPRGDLLGRAAARFKDETRDVRSRAHERRRDTGTPDPQPPRG